MLGSVILTLVASMLFSIPNPDPGETGNILNQEGHILLLTIGGLGMIISGILGFLFIKDNIPPSELPPKKSFKSELRETFNIKLLKENKDFFRYLVAMTVFMSGVNGILSFMFNFIFSLELSTLDFAIVMGIASPILIISILLLGRLSDKVGRKKIVPPTILISCVGFILVPIIAENPPINVPLFTVSLSLIFLGTLGAIVPLTTWYQDLLPEGEKAKFAGIYNITNTVSMIIGTFAAGIVATLLKGVVLNPLAWIFAVVPIFFIASIPIFLSVKDTMQKVNKTE